MKDLSKLIICIIAIATTGILTTTAQENMDTTAVKGGNDRQGHFILTGASYVPIYGNAYDKCGFEVLTLGYSFLKDSFNAGISLGLLGYSNGSRYSSLETGRAGTVMAPASGDFSLSDARAARNIADGFGFGGIHGRDSVRFCVFTLNSDRFAVNDYIRVGDPVSKVYNMGGSVRDIKNTDGGGKLYWWASFVTDHIEDEDLMYNPAFWYDKNGIITKIELYYD